MRVSIWGLSAMALVAALGAGLACGAPAAAQDSDIPPKFEPATSSFDYDRREVMIPMRDGVKLQTFIVVPRGAKNAPIMLDRTPYNAGAPRPPNGASSHMAAILPRGSDVFVADGYIVVFQDVRGKHGSEGDYINERPLRGPLNATKTDHATDAWDTIDWLVKNVPETNGKVGMIGASYDGMMVLMALSDPHPALKVAVPVNPVANTYKNDDDFHGGAFRLVGYDYYYAQDAEKGEGPDLWRPGYDDYDTFLRAGSAADFMKTFGVDKLPFPARMAQHPAYDDYWKAQALDEILATKAAEGADPVRGQPVGPGGHVRRGGDLSGAGQEGRRPRHGIPRHGPVEARRRDGRRLQPRRDQVRWRYGVLLPQEYTASLRQPVSEGRGAQGG